jgi:transcriptional regulator with XRE-family HTH domain
VASNTTTLGSVLRRRRKQLELTQQEIARRVAVRANYVGYLERDLRRPSTNVLAKLAKVLDLDRRELYFLANPQVRDFVNSEAPDPQQSTWDAFRTNKRVHTRHGVTQAELKALQGVSAIGPIRSTRDYLFILQAIRTALLDE